MNSPLAPKHKRPRGRPKLTPEQAREHFQYAPDSGTFTPAPTVTASHGPVLRLGGYLIGPPRLAYVLMGEVPPRVIRPRDGDPLNLKWSNIRPRSPRLRELRGIKGISTLKSTRFEVSVYAKGHALSFYVGSSHSIEEAKAMRDRAEARLTACEGKTRNEIKEELK